MLDRALKEKYNSPSLQFKVQSFAGGIPVIETSFYLLRNCHKEQKVME